MAEDKAHSRTPHASQLRDAAIDHGERHGPGRTAGTDDARNADDPAGNDSQHWSDAAIYHLHEATLYHALRTLQARGQGADKGEVLQWIFAPTRMVAVLTRGAHRTEVALPAALTPFSFELCCRISGLQPDLLRDGLKPLLEMLRADNDLDA